MTLTQSQRLARGFWKFLGRENPDFTQYTECFVCYALYSSLKNKPVGLT